MASLSSEEDEDSLEHTLLVVREVNVFKVPPRSTSGGHKCADWLVSSKIWSGRLRVVGVKDVCEIRLEDPNSGELFATCRVLPGQREASVQNAVDSSRYFVLRIDDGRGRHAFIGLGFNERNEAFDFNVALTDHQKHSQEPKESPRAPEANTKAGSDSDPAPSAKFRLKEGETIKINVKPQGERKGLFASSSSDSASGAVLHPLAPPPSTSGSGNAFRLAPPPGTVAPRLAAQAPGSTPPSTASSAPSFPAPSKTDAGAQTKSAKGAASNTPAAGWTPF